MSFMRSLEAATGGVSFAYTLVPELFNSSMPKEVQFAAFAIFSLSLIHGIISSDHGASAIPAPRINIGGDADDHFN